jgi:hypothetical protein
VFVALREPLARSRAVNSNGWVTLGLAFGTGAVGILLLLGGLLAMLDSGDRRGLLNVLRHPLRTAFGEADMHRGDDRPR